LKIVKLKIHIVSFIHYRKIFYVFSGLLIAGGVVSLAIFGVPLSHEFTGGALLEVEFTGRLPEGNEPRPGGTGDIPTTAAIAEALKDAGIASPAVQPMDKNRFIIRSKPMDEALHQAAVERLKALGSENLTERRFETIGPTIGRELRVHSIWALLISLLGIYLYVMTAFWRTSGRFRPSLYALIGIATLLHDVVITAGLLSIINFFIPLDFGASLVAAFLVIIGYSINDTIIIYDRIRELARGAKNESVAAIVDRAIASAIRRSLFTSSATLLSLVAVFFFGGASLKTFALALVIGISIGSYSSICIASPLLFDLAHRPRRGSP
jgi:preprotein translocase subunit SecF